MVKNVKRRYLEAKKRLAEAKKKLAEAKKKLAEAEKNLYFYTTDAGSRLDRAAVEAAGAFFVEFVEVDPGFPDGELYAAWKASYKDYEEFENTLLKIEY